MGSRSKIWLAYIAGFLDGDGSLMLQIKKRSDNRTGSRFMITICFYQDSQHEKTLFWIRKVLGIGYVSRRKDGITELRINGYKRAQEILKKLSPYIRFKKKQARALNRVCNILNSTKFSKLTNEQLKQIVSMMLVIQNENYVTKRKRTKKELFRILGLTP